MPIRRRTFLAAAAAAAAPLVVPAGLRQGAFAAPPAAVGDTVLDDLRKRVSGSVIAPSDKAYDRVRKVRNRAFDDVRPRAVLMAANEADVAHAVAWAAEHGVPIVPRCGGHSYIGQSTTEGLVVSLVPIREIKVDKPAMTADIGAGSVMVDVNVALFGEDVGIPTGSCPSVGVAGLTLGGGISFSSRKWGLTADSLIGVTMVLASGKTVEVDAKRHPELLWASRGGGGGQFGIVTNFRFKVHPVEPISHYKIVWPWKSADAVLDAWQKWAPHVPDELFSVCVLTKGKTEPSIRSHGRYFGSKANLRRLLAPLLTAAKPSDGPIVYNTTLWKTGVTGPKCWPDPSVCHSWNHPEPGRYKQASYTVKSDFFKRTLCPVGRDTLIRMVEKGQQRAISWGGVILDGFGGVINRVTADATAYVHRDSLFQAEYVAHWNPRRIDADAVAANKRWMREFYAAMRPYASGECYQNYPDLDLPDWEQAYYGQNLPRLKALKREVDPDGLFRGRQVLEPA